VNAGLVDSHGRTMRDLRISLTERCNFRCLYCLPETEEAANFYRVKMGVSNEPKPPFVFKLPHRRRDEILSYEEIDRLVRIAADLGIQKVRLTGGEPLLRRDVPDLVRRIAAIPGIEDLAMTTNGFFFEKQARDLVRAGLKRISFSMDSLDPANFKKITGRDGLNEVQGSIRLAKELGLTPVKVNAVVIRGINDHELESLAAFAAQEGFAMRFIEFMPLDSSRAWLKKWSCPAAKFWNASPRASIWNASSQIPPKQQSAGKFAAQNPKSESSRPSPNPSAATATAFA
jgi:cyclic pyranopterin phosphate synthase